MQQINFQPLSKLDLRPSGELNVHSLFWTIQGEGPHVGRPAVFIRLAGCNLQCPGCDTEYTNGAKWLDVRTIVGLVGELATTADPKKPVLVVITGGEPFRQNLIPLIRTLKDLDYDVQVESNGTLGLPADEWHEDLDFDIVVSPKAGKVAATLWSRIIAYKYVLDCNAIAPDGLPSSVLGMPAAPARPHEGYEGPIYVQPADEGGGNPQDAYVSHMNLQAAIKSAMTNNFTLCIQTHKIINME